MKIKCPDCSTSYEIKTEALGPEGRSVKCAKCGSRWFVSPEDEGGTLDFAAVEGDAAEAVPSGTEPDNDEAEWATDAVVDTGEIEDEPDIPDDEDEPEDAAPAPKRARTAKDEAKFAADLAAEKAALGDQKDIETLAKRPKIIVNPDKFRRNQIGAVLNWVMKRNFRRIGGFALFGVALAVCAGFVLMRDDIVKQSPDLASLFQLVGFQVNLRGLEFRNLRTFTEVEDGKRVLVVEGSIRNLLDETNAVPAVRLAIRGADLQEVYAWTVEPRTKLLNALDETRFRTILADPPGDASDIQVRFVERGKRQIVLE
ncbi:MJ0042-type zinc finger domain-containing protein [Roseibium salinum]|uniref:Zinc-ribbon domain-containing protein n=1 Tax=Roseibium salinum TaxID=1604349 RepID=A0ABT3R776_9HYPH|nr:MJ0042-type zinc finger domain-containing protein [Roseibium sp. DSM 29163]MCX2724882.1 zinc-ribbon domain-containing protein [Roseibium sp. DSM 29163]MDN3721176.1 zinc-ribbon domain-containing protein [Roseibium salinum]